MKHKPTLEKISPDFGSSLVVRQFADDSNSGKPFWHFHEELELVYVNKGKGKRHIGNHISYYNNSQLILIGKNLPHNGFVDRLTREGKETIVQFKSDFLGETFFDMPEMESIKTMFIKSRKGILFGPEIKNKLGNKIEDLAKIDGVHRITSLLNILAHLSLTDDYKILNADGFAFEAEKQDSSRINKVFDYVNEHFKDPITLEEIADEVSMTVPAFCRFFKKSTSKTFTQLVNQYRIVHATKLLNETDLSITDICFESGFNNFSHFNKTFKETTGKSASKYRSEIIEIVES